MAHYVKAIPLSFVVVCFDMPASELICNKLGTKKKIALGLACKARLKELLKGRKTKLVCSKEGKGKFGRILADVISIDKKTGAEFNVNNRLIDEGYARPYYGGKKVPWV